LLEGGVYGLRSGLGGFDGGVELGDLLLEGANELVEAVELGLELEAKGIICGESGELLGKLGFAGAGLVESGGGLVAGGLEVGGVFYAGDREEADREADKETRRLGDKEMGEATWGGGI